MEKQKNPYEYVENIKESGFSIYDPIQIGDADLWIPSQHLETILDEKLKGISLKGLALRTRSKFVKEKVCESLGYPIPKSFSKTQPRFLGQQLDTYVQKSNNLQIWNEELSATRRYVLIKVSSDDIIEKVKVVTGDTLAILDTTGTLTQKYQASLVRGNDIFELISENDTDNLTSLLSDDETISLSDLSPIDDPVVGTIIPIFAVFEKLKSLVGQKFLDAGIDQERNRGAELHKLISQVLGFANYKDDGKFPDIRNQLIEVKLQTSPTIDLGLVRPNSIEPLDISQLDSKQIRHCDVRYALFYANTDGEQVTLTNFYLTTGESFFNRFAQFQGKVLNKKLQIPLPKTFFD